ncbi:MAG: hypothetical protein R3C45_05060 [Phycisphaerales bacterium]
MLQADGLTEERCRPSWRWCWGFRHDLDENPPMAARYRELPARLLTTYQLVRLSRERPPGVSVSPPAGSSTDGLMNCDLDRAQLEPVIATVHAIRRAGDTPKASAATVQLPCSVQTASRSSPMTTIDLSEIAEDGRSSSSSTNLIEAIERRAATATSSRSNRNETGYRIDGTLVEASIPRVVARFQPAIVSASRS